MLGALILSVSGVICKILGAFYKIPLTNILGTGGIGIYYMVFPVFALILSLTSTSMPAAISRLISREIAVGNPSGARRIFRGALLMLMILSGAFALVLMLLSGVLSRLQGAPDIASGYLVVAPAIFVVGVLSAIRGWFQGHMDMVPTGVSQIIEQIFKLFLGLFLAVKLMPQGLIYGAVGALLGITLSEVFALLYIIIHYLFTKENIPVSRSDKAPIRETIREVFLASVPFVLGSSIFPLSLMLDSFLIVNLLERIGLSNSLAVSLLGINSGIISTMISLPTIISLSLSFAIIPTLARNKTQEDSTKKVSLAIKLNLFLLFPCALVYLFFAPQILGLLFGAVEGLNIAAVLLQVSAVSVLFLGFLQLVTAILQGMGKPYVPVISLGIAIVVKIILEVILLGIPGVNILGAVISNMACFFVGLVINLIYLRKLVRFRVGGLTPMVLSSLGLLSACFLGLRLFDFLGGTGLVLSFLLGATVFVGLVILGGTFSKQELGFLIKKKQNITQSSDGVELPPE